MANNFQPLSGREFPRYSAIKTFFRLPHAQIQEDFDVALLGVPFDSGVSYRPGARFAPTSVREMSSLGRGFHIESGHQVFKKLRVADVGDCSVVPLSLEQSYTLIEDHATALLKAKKRIISVGGDHSITLPLLRAFRKHYGVPLTLIHLDAHLDTYPAAWGCEYHHGSFLRHAVEEGLVEPKRVIQFGIRGPLAGPDDWDFSRTKGFMTFTMDKIREGHLTQLLSNLEEDIKGEKGPVYITTDVDCMDPSVAPGTGTPVPGGLTSYEVIKIIRSLPLSGRLVGGDVVEIAPPYDTAQITSLVGVEIVFQYLNQMCS